MQPAVLNAVILGTLAVTAIGSFVVAPSAPASTSVAAEPPTDATIAPKTGAAVVLETGRPPVPLVRLPREEARKPAAAAAEPALPSWPQPAPMAEVLAVPPSAPVAHGPAPRLDDPSPAENQMQSVLASLPRGPDVRYWIVPMDDGRVKVVVGRVGDAGPEGWSEKKPKHRRRGWN
jgi:hypothetical protein